MLYFITDEICSCKEDRTIRIKVMLSKNNDVAWSNTGI
jgi:hypothetical protein